MLTVSQWGIMLFAATTALNVAGLLLDLALVANDLPTVTEFCRRNPWMTALVMAINAAGLFGLAVHFTNGKG